MRVEVLRNRKLRLRADATNSSDMEGRLTMSDEKPMGIVAFRKQRQAEARKFAETYASVTKTLYGARAAARFAGGYYLNVPHDGYGETEVECSLHNETESFIRPSRLGVVGFEKSEDEIGVLWIPSERFEEFKKALFEKLGPLEPPK